MSTLIFANGDLEQGMWLQPYLAQATRLIAADGGSRHLYLLNRPPDVIIGDLDSVTEEVRQWLQTAAAQFIIHPAAKDETDLELALLYGAQFAEEILVFGALGGRLDQTLANILLLAHPALQGRSVQLVEPYQRAWLAAGEVVVNGRSGDTLSLIPLGGDVSIQQTTGLKWPLHDDVLQFGPARGISNVMVADEARVWVANGRLLCIHTQQTWQR
ncbi:MAG: thiamine diphosphokinase [Ardenticatenaceae bacterium]|nr:thiamine diphosphokinase [Ardenticatenaceae bacterium]